MFYHIYPIGLTERQREQTDGGYPRLTGCTEEWLPHIQKLGCDAIYIGPLFESSTHGYDTRDYRVVDRRLGIMKILPDL